MENQNAATGATICFPHLRLPDHGVSMSFQENTANPSDSRRLPADILQKRASIVLLECHYNFIDIWYMVAAECDESSAR